MNVTETIDQLTAKGRDAMAAIGRQEVSFFDEGIVAGAGSWGGILTADLGHKSSGVLNRLKTLGLFDTFKDTDPADADCGDWWSLTELGAAVANKLAEPTTGISFLERGGVSAKAGRVWTDLYIDGVKIAGLRTEHLAAIRAYLEETK